MEAHMQKHKEQRDLDSLLDYPWYVTNVLQEVSTGESLSGCRQDHFYI